VCQKIILKFVLHDAIIASLNHWSGVLCQAVLICNRILMLFLNTETACQRVLIILIIK